jgi:hypothetical protein
MAVHTPKGKNTSVAMVVFPGAGYHVLAMDLEGTEICDWLNSLSITALLLKYHVANSGPNYDAQLKHHVEPKAQTALEDAQRAIGLVRLHAAEWHIDPHKVGVIGFLPADSWWQMSAHILPGARIRRWMRQTRKAAVRISASPFIRDT